MLRKIYLEDKLSNENREGNIMIIFNRSFNVSRLYPLKIEDRSKEDVATVNKANEALKIFYVSFVAAIVFAFLNAVFNW